MDFTHRDVFFVLFRIEKDIYFLKHKVCFKNYSYI